MTQEGKFSKIAPADMTGMELTGKTLGLIANSDIVNVSVPLTPSRKNLIAGNTFNCFRKSAILTL